MHEESRPPEPQPSTPPIPPRRRRGPLLAAGFLAALGLLGNLLWVATDTGTIKIEVDDPAVVVRVDGKAIRIEAMGEPLTLRAGEHDLLVTRGDLVVKTQSFALRRGEAKVVSVEFQPARPALARSGPAPVREPPTPEKQVEPEPSGSSSGTEPAPSTPAPSPPVEDPKPAPVPAAAKTDEPAPTPPPSVPAEPAKEASSESPKAEPPPPSDRAAVPRSAPRDEVRKTEGGPGPVASAAPTPPPPPAPAEPAREIRNTIGMTLVLVPAGAFAMGSPDADPEARYDEKLRHRVRISTPFYLGRYEVMQEEYQQVMGANPSHFKGSGRLPVERVTWYEAVDFCNRLSAKEKLHPYYKVSGRDVTILGGDGYRLPTEGEYACRGGSEARYGFGGDAARLGDYAWYYGNSDGKTHPAGQKRPNKFGLYDMHGNVWEWCWDGYANDYYERSPVDDPAGPSGASVRVFRGGSWINDPRDTRSADRFRSTPDNRSLILGFRVARVQSAR